MTNGTKMAHFFKLEEGNKNPGPPDNRSGAKLLKLDKGKENWI